MLPKKYTFINKPYRQNVNHFTAKQQPIENNEFVNTNKKLKKKAWKYISYEAILFLIYTISPLITTLQQQKKKNKAPFSTYNYHQKKGSLKGNNYYSITQVVIVKPWSRR
ncbi:unnamed protein product [Cunninghamella echinulata]